MICNTCNNGWRAMRAVLREIKWALNLQPWTAHQQYVRRCIFVVDHHWIIFHLITSQLLRADERGIKSNLTPHKRFPYDQTHLSTCSMFRLSNSIDENYPMMGKSMTEEVIRNGQRADVVWRNRTKLSEEIFFEAKPRAGRRHYQVGTEE